MRQPSVSTQSCARVIADASPPPASTTPPIAPHSTNSEGQCDSAQMAQDGDLACRAAQTGSIDPPSRASDRTSESMLASLPEPASESPLASATPSGEPSNTTLTSLPASDPMGSVLTSDARSLSDARASANESRAASCPEATSARVTGVPASQTKGARPRSSPQPSAN